MRASDQEAVCPEIRTPRLIIRLGREEDARAVLKYYEENRAHLAPWEPLRSDEFYTEAYWQTQLARNRKEFEEGRSARLFLCPRDRPDEVIGAANLSGITRGVAQ